MVLRAMRACASTCIGAELREPEFDATDRRIVLSPIVARAARADSPVRTSLRRELAPRMHN